MSNLQHTLGRYIAFVLLCVVVVATLQAIDREVDMTVRQERLYFPSGKFLVESTLGFREAAADYLWFRFIQYYGAYAQGYNDFRYFDLLIDSIVKLDPKFVEAYYFASLVYWSSFGDNDGSINMLRRGIEANPDKAKLPFQIGFMYYVIEHDYERAALWFELAGKCPDATDKEMRFAAFARHKAGDERVSLALWKELYRSTDSPQMKELAEKMIRKCERKIEIQRLYGDDFIGPIPEL
jgi:tetratricopeptide (TPR) repeat protein